MNISSQLLKELGIDISRLLPLAPLMTKRVEDLTLVDVSKVFGAFGFSGDVDEQLHLAALKILQDEDINRVADVISSPNAVAQLVSLVRPPEKAGLGDCDACGTELSDADDVSGLLICPICSHLNGIKESEGA